MVLINQEKRLQELMNQEKYFLPKMKNFLELLAVSPLTKIEEFLLRQLVGSL